VLKVATSLSVEKLPPMDTEALKGTLVGMRSDPSVVVQDLAAQLLCIVK